MSLFLPAGVEIGAVVTGAGVALVLWAMRRVRLLRETFLLHVDRDAGRIVRVPPWRLPVATGVLAGVIVLIVFALLQP